MSSSTTDRPKTRHGLAVLGATALLLAGCGESSTDAMGDRTTQTCADLTAYTDALRNLASTVGPDATVAEVQAARDQAEAAQQALEESISGVTDDRTDDIARSWDALVTAFGQIDDDATLAEAADSLRTEAQAVVDATASVREDLDCP
jgi:outer membrane murein-binding lipoprotein Lpp